MATRTIDLTRTGRLRIGIVAPPWLPVPPVSYGGTEQVVDLLARGLHDAGHDVVLWATGDSTCPVPLRWHHRTAVGTTAPPHVELVHAEAAHRALGRDRDVIADHTLVGPLVAALLHDVPVVVTCHGPLAGDLGDHARLVARRARTIAISRAQAAPVADLQPDVVHHGIDVGAIPEGAGAGGYALFVGRMSADKGVHVAIDAARAAGLPLRIAAKMWEADERAYYAAEVAPRLGGDVEYLGVPTPAEKLALLRDAAVLVNPVAWPEPFGLVMVEALASGTPVVARPAGAAPEIVRHGRTGFLSTRAEDLPGHLTAALSLDRRRCRADAVARFAAGRMVAGHERVLRDAAAHPPLVPSGR